MKATSRRWSRSRRTACRFRWLRRVTTRGRLRKPADWSLSKRNRRRGWSSVYQSRSGRPVDPWLAPDILDHLRDLKQRGATRVLIHPIGFLSDHLEVLYDLDVEARDLCEELGLEMVRSATVGTHPRFVTMLRMLVEERTGAGPPAAIGGYGANHDFCPETAALPRRGRQ